MPARPWFIQLVVAIALLPFVVGLADNDDTLAPFSQIQNGCMALRDVNTEELAARLVGSRQGHSPGSNLPGPDGLAAMLQACRYLTDAVPVPDDSSQFSVKAEVANVAPQRRLLPPHQSSLPDWLVDGEVYYLPFLLIAGLVIFLVVVIYEGIILRSSFLGARCKRHVNEAADVLEDLTDGPEVKIGADGDSSPEKPEQNPWSDDQVEGFWAAVQKKIDGPVEGESPAPTSEIDTVGFVQREFPALEANSKTTITLERTGSCKGALVVRARTLPAEKAGAFEAEAGKDYVDADVQVRFEDGQKESTFEIELLSTDTKWLPTRWFWVELQEVVSGGAKLGGPTLAHWGRSSECPLARVFIVQDDTFPSGIPEEKLTCNHAEFWLCFYYIKNRVRLRGKKFWKTMAGVCYEPVHSVVVVPLIQSFILDFAAQPAEGGSYTQIIYCALVQLFSAILLRGGDYMQVNNRGRTGGARQLHRTQLLSKLLMMDYQQQFIHPGSTWFYSALNNVDSMVADCYWQIMVLVQCIWALLLCLLVLVWKSWYKRTKADEPMHIENFLPVILLLIIIPLAFVLVWSRRKTTAGYLEDRMKGEESWVEIFAWLSEHGRRLYTFGAKEFAKIETMFTNRSQKFIKKHGLARDYTNDSKWITTWLCQGIYCLMLCWGAFKLFETRLGIGDDNFTSGDCLILIQVFDKFGKYMIKFEGGIVAMQKASVAIRRVSQLLGLPEQKKLVDDLKTSSKHADGTASTTAASRDHIVLRNVQVTIPHTTEGFGPLVPIQAKMQGKDTCLPLGKVIYIKGGTENRRLTFLSVLAQMISPSTGDVMVPKSEWSILIPANAIDLPHTTVKDDFMLAGATEDMALKLSQLFELNPKDGHVRLPSGKASLQALARALLRNPTILLAVRPTSSTAPELREKIMHLLLAWQASGGAHVFVDLLGNEPAPAREQGTQQRRTLVISGEEPPAFIPQERLHVFDLDEEY